MDSTMESKYPFRSTVHPVHGQDGQHYRIHAHSGLPYPTVHPVLLYHGLDGQYDESLHIRHYPSVHPVHGRDGQHYESKYPSRSTLSYCPSRPIIPWTGWTVR